MAQQGSKYGLRTRFVVSKRQRKDALSSEELNQPAAKATIAAGLRPGLLTKAERLRFSTRAKEYLEARNGILEKWEADVSTFLTADACVGGADSEALIREAHLFLCEQGCINFGIPAGEPEPETGVSDEALKESLLDLLATVDLDVWTEKKIRLELEKRLGISLGEKKAFIRAHVVEFLESGGAKRKRAKKTAPKKPAGKVIIVGAGPAGLAAGLHLKRCGVEVVVLEARDRVGGRVHTHLAAGSTAALDLGASIITGTETDAEKGLRPDPSAVVARQLGLELHALVTQLPLYDGVSGDPVTKESDARMERLRDALMDAARSRVEDLGEDAVSGESLGGAIDAALAQLAKEPILPDGSAVLPDAAPAMGLTKKSLAQALDDTEDPEADIRPPTPAASDGDQATSHGAVPESGRGQPEDSAAAGQPGEPASEPNQSTWLTRQPDGDTPAGVETDHTANVSEETNEQMNGEASLAVTASAADEAPDAHMMSQGDVNLGQGPDAPTTTQEGDESDAHVLSQKDADLGQGPDAPTTTQEEDDSAKIRAIVRGLTEAEQRLLGWHWANLEYGCSARLADISLAHWNQDEEFGGFGGPHCMVRGGYGSITTALAARLDVRLGMRVESVDTLEKTVKVTMSTGEVIEGQAVIVTVPLGCLKAQHITFRPPLPAWKVDAIQKLGFGTLNKVVLEFPEAFWDVSQDYFGVALPYGPATRGSAGFTFWSLQSVTGAPQLTALVSGEAAYASEKAPEDELRGAALAVLRTLFGERVSEPTSVTVTRWLSEEFSKGSYSYVAMGASAETYDQLAQAGAPARDVCWRAYLQGREHPDTVGGAMLTGMREAVRALHMLKGDSDEVGAAAAADVDTTTARKRKQAEEGDGKQRKKQSEGKRKKRKAGEAGSSDEEGAWRDGPPQRHAARTAEMIWQEEEQKEAARASVKAVLRAVMEAAAGDVRSVLGCMAEATDHDARASLLQAMLISSKEGLAAMAASVEVMQRFDAYIQELLPDRPAFHVLELVLKVLSQLPVNFPVLKKSGMAATVRQKLAEHPMRSIRTAADGVIQRWLAKADPTGDSIPELARVPHKAVERKPEAKPVPEPQEEEEEDPEYAAQIELVRQEAEEAARLAKQYAEHADAIEAQLKEAMAQGLATLPSIEGFSEYAGTNGKRISSKSAAREDKMARRKQRASGSGGTSATNGSDKHTASGSYQARKEIGDYVTSLLKPMFASKRLSKEDYKSIAKSVVAKVVERRAPGTAELSGKERIKIKELVDKYVSRLGK